MKKEGLLLTKTTEVLNCLIDTPLIWVQTAKILQKTFYTIKISIELQVVPFNKVAFYGGVCGNDDEIGWAKVQFCVSKLLICKEQFFTFVFSVIKNTPSSVKRKQKDWQSWDIKFKKLGFRSRLILNLICVCTL